MQTLIDKNESLNKEIKNLQQQIETTKSAPVAVKKPAAAAKPKKKNLFGTLRKFMGGKEEASTEMSPKQVEAINNVHHLILTDKYDDADSFINENTKLIFGKTKSSARPQSFLELKDQFGETVLMKAIRDGKQKLVLNLIERGAIIDVADNEGETPLMIAAKYGEFEMLQALIQKANRDAKTQHSKKTALHFAAEYGHIEVVNELLDNGCDPLLEDAEGRAAWQTSEDIACINAIKVLAKKHKEEAGEEIEDELKNIEDPAKAGAGKSKERTYSQDEEMKPLFDESKRLMKLKARLELQLEDLERKRSAQNKFAGLADLSDKERDQVLGLDTGVSTLTAKFHALVLRGNEPSALEEVEAMLTEKKKGSVVNKDAKDKFGETALMKACRLGYDEMVAYLLLYKCDVDAKDVDGHTALMKGAQFGKKVCCLKLLEEGADIDATSMNGKLTALMLAAQRGHGDICEMLVTEGADHSVKNSDGKIALDLVNNAEAKDMLQRAMDEHPVKRAPVQI